MITKTQTPLQSRVLLPACRARQLIWVGGLILMLCFSVSIVSGQDSQAIDVIKVDSNLVSVPVIVSDRQGRYIPGLKANDFKLLDNNTEQNLAFFDAAEEPLNVALLLDTSKSTQLVLDKIKKAAKNFLKELRPQDRAMIVSFDFAIHQLSPLTEDRKVLEKAIKHAEVGEYVGTVLFDAVARVADREFRTVTGRKAIILLTDGQDHGSLISASELLASESESDTMVYSVFYESFLSRVRGGGFPRRGGIFGRQDPLSGRFPGPWPGRSERRERRRDRDLEGAEFLTRLSDETSGRFYRSEVTDLKKTFTLIADELRNQYRLGFYPDNTKQDDSPHQLKVKVSRPDVAVRARQQYRTRPTK